MTRIIISNRVPSEFQYLNRLFDGRISSIKSWTNLGIEICAIEIISPSKKLIMNFFLYGLRKESDHAYIL